MPIKSSFNNPVSPPSNPIMNSPIPTRWQVESARHKYDSRDMSWTRNNPDHRQALDTKMLRGKIQPRSRAISECNLVQLFERFSYTLIDYQMEYSYSGQNRRVLRMPFSVIPPQEGWQLKDVDSDTLYTVKRTLMSVNTDGKETYAGAVELSSDGPADNRRLRWVDQFGEKDGVKKVIAAMAMDDTDSIVKQRVAAGEVADNKGAPFSPVITYKTRTYEPASITGKAFGSRRQVKPKLLHSETDVENPLMLRLYQVQSMDSLVEFNVYCIGGKTADQLMIWLKNYFSVYNSVLTYLGVEQMHFWAASSVPSVTTVSYDISKRAVVVYFRIQEVTSKLAPKIREYTMQATAYTGSSFPMVTSEPEPTEDYFSDTSGDYAFGQIYINE